MWFKVDDKLHDHRKSRRAGKAAMGVWVLAGSWCAANLTDGFVPKDMLRRWGTPADARRLVEVGLWIPSEKDGENGWLFHDWLALQPDARTVRLKQEAESKGGSHGNHTRWHVRRKVKDPECPFCQGPDQVPDRGGESGQPIAPESPDPSRPVPARPDPSLREEQRPRKRACQLPDDFRPSERHVDLAKELDVDLRREWVKFCDHHRAKGSTFKDWSAALNNWIRKAAEYGGTPALRLAANGMPSFSTLDDVR